MSKSNEDRANIAAGMSVAERRDKAAELGVSMSDFKAGAWRPSQGATPKPSSSSSSSSPKPQSPSTSSSSSYSPSPKPPSSSSSGGSSGGSSSSYSSAKNKANSYSDMKVAERREDAKSKGMSMSEWKSTYLNGGGGSSSSGGGNNYSAMSVGERRQDAQLKDMSMGEWKSKYLNGGGIGQSGSSGSTNNNVDTASLSPWQKFSSGFDQGKHDAFALDLWNKQDPNSGMSKGPQFKGAQMGPNGFIMDANAPMVLPRGVKEAGFKPGDQFFDAENYTPHAENAWMDPSMGGAITGKIAYFKPDGTAIHEVAHDANPNWDKYQDGQERMSSEGLYQDRYNVGYHGADDMGDMYASNAALGSIASYFKDYNAGKKDFSEAYHSFVDGDRTGGYAGDVLKMIDQGRMKVSDDQYNRIVVDAQNYDWDKRNEIAGIDAGQASYDARTGGISQSSINANQEWQDRQQSMGLQSLQETAEIGGGNAGSSLEANVPFGYQYTPNEYQRKYDLGAQSFMTNWRDTNFS